MKVAIIGAGSVGSTAAYTMALEGTASEIVLVDIDQKLAQAQAEDILHATPHTNPIRIYAGSYQAIHSSAAVILSCGVGQKEGESRLDLLKRNAMVFEEVIPRVVAAAPDAILVVASNPVDILTQITSRISALRPTRIIGSGTILDTARFRSLLSEHLNVSSRSVHGYVVGEHGDSEVLIWSSVHIGGIQLCDFAEQVAKPITASVRTAIDDGVRHAAARIIRGKGSTYYGIGMGLSRIIRAIRDDEGAVLTVSSPGRRQQGLPEGSFSIPRVIGENGIIAELLPDLDGDELSNLKNSAGVIAQAVDAIGY